ncbi:MAG: tetratricopeptide repeat protein [Armatimonadota bacterium]|nr:tetratricopeptide repeat protein [Armatimonadota bacterium]
MRLWNPALAAALAASLLSGAAAAERTSHSKTAPAHLVGKRSPAKSAAAKKTAKNGNKQAAAPVAFHATAPAKGRPGTPLLAGSRGQGGAPSVWPQSELRRLNQSDQIRRQGDAEAKRGEWQAAIQDYQEAISIWPENTEALYALGRYAAAAGDTARAIEYYRAGIYDKSGQGSDVWREGNVAPLMEYAILLSKAGQEQEALVVYRRAVDGLNYEDGKQNLDVLLPDFGPDDRSYTPRMLQAMAHVAVAYEQEDFDKALALSHLEQAVALAPASPIPYFYRGQFAIRHGDYKGAPTYYEKAAHLGDAQVGAAVEKAMKLLN